MSLAGAGRGWPGRAPFALQVMALLVLTLVAAQGMTVAVVLLMPPPRPTFYRLNEVADALRNQPVQVQRRDLPRDKPLVRTVDSDFQPDDFENRGGSRRALAQLLNVTPDRVVLSEEGLPFPYSLTRRQGPGFGGGPGPGPGQPRSDGPGGQGPGSRDGPRRPPMEGRRDEFQRPLIGSFTAALRQVDGSWVVVRPPPERFPNPWQMRMLAWLAGCILVLAPAGWLFARRMTAPLRRFAAAAERLGRDPRAPLMSVSGPAEIGAAATAFNEMQGRLTRYVEDRTAMVGAISHDMRTPLARMRFKLEGAPELVRDSVLADVAQMEGMISAVLSFIRNASEVRHRERLDLLSVLEVTADNAEVTGGEVSLEAAQSLIVEADSLAVQSLFANLVENAIKYGGRARVTLTREGGEAVVRVADDGPGLPPGELERVFQPFYRAEAARTLEGGVGLGLAVARSIARVHGGDVTLANGLKGLIATVTLPLPTET